MQQAQLSYAEGRYIMMYLYSKGLLRKWYDAYTDSFKDDASGGKALEAVLGKKLSEIDKDFAAYIKALPPMLKSPPKTYLGIGTSMAAPDGLLVATVGPGSGAADAGLKVGDVLISVNGKRMYDREILVAYISKLPVGKTIQVEFRRDGKYQTVPVVLKDISTAPKKPAAGSSPTAPAGTAPVSGKKVALQCIRCPKSAAGRRIKCHETALRRIFKSFWATIAPPSRCLATANATTPSMDGYFAVPRKRPSRSPTTCERRRPRFFATSAQFLAGAPW